MRTLIIAAHPDDEVLGCGGTIAKMSRQGHEITIAILGEGITSRFSKPGEAPQALIKKIRAASREAGKMLGATSIHLYNFPDNRFDTVALLEVIKKVEQIIADVKPRMIFTHHGGDLNVDHSVVNRAVLTATRPVAGNPVKTVYTFETPSSTDWSFNKLSPSFAPNTFIDISSFLNVKTRAMELYESEARPFPHPRSAEALRAAARRWGSVAGMQAAEAFELIRDFQ